MIDISTLKGKPDSVFVIIVIVLFLFVIIYYLILSYIIDLMLILQEKNGSIICDEIYYKRIQKLFVFFHILFYSIYFFLAELGRTLFACFEPYVAIKNFVSGMCQYLWCVPVIRSVYCLQHCVNILPVSQVFRSVYCLQHCVNILPVSQVFRSVYCLQHCVNILPVPHVFIPVYCFQHCANILPVPQVFMPVCCF